MTAHGSASLRRISHDTPTPTGTLGYEFAGDGVAGSSSDADELWNIGNAQGKGAQACYEAVLQDSRCSEYFTYVWGGDLNCGCKGNSGLPLYVNPGTMSIAKYYKMSGGDPPLPPHPRPAHPLPSRCARCDRVCSLVSLACSLAPRPSIHRPAVRPSLTSEDVVSLRLRL